MDKLICKIGYLQKLQQYSTIQKIQWNGADTMQDIKEIPQKPTNGINIQYVNSNSGYVPKRFEKTCWKKLIYFYTHIHNSIIHTGQQTEGIQVSMDRQFHKQTVVYTQWNMIQPLKVGTSDNVAEPYSHYVKWNKPDQKRTNILWFR